MILKGPTWRISLNATLEDDDFAWEIQLFNQSPSEALRFKAKLAFDEESMERSISTAHIMAISSWPHIDDTILSRPPLGYDTFVGLIFVEKESSAAFGREYIRAGKWWVTDKRFNELVGKTELVEMKIV